MNSYLVLSLLVASVFAGTPVNLDSSDIASATNLYVQNFDSSNGVAFVVSNSYITTLRKWILVY